MNTNPIPHIGATVRQRLLVRDLMMHREHAAEAALFNSSPSAVVRKQLAKYTQQQREAEIERVLRDVAESEPAPPPLTRRQVVVIAIGWVIVLAFSCWISGRSS